MTHEVLKTEVINTERSRYSVELVKAKSGKMYVSIGQITFLDYQECSESNVKIRLSDLQSIINVLTSYLPEGIAKKPQRPKLRADLIKELINRYLNKCLEIETLAVQFDCSVSEIEKVLLENNIALTSNSINKYKSAKKFWRRKRRSRSI